MKKTLWIAILLSSCFLWAQSDQSAPSSQPSNNRNENGQVTVRGCVSRSNGDYVLMKQDPGNTYQLEKSDNVKLRSYLGQRVEITGTKSETIPSSEDAMNRTGSASPVTIKVESIRTISKECESR